MPPATIVDHDPTWPTQARQLLNDAHSALEPLIGSDQFRYEHIGSTAVPGLAAKPILDLQIRMPTLPSLAQLTDLLAPTPFIPERGARPDSPGVHRAGRPPGDPEAPALYEKRLFHAPTPAAILHIRRTDSPFAQYVIEFRDWLRNHPDQAKRYEHIKRDLAKQRANDPDYDDYTRGKSAFFKEIQPQLRAWTRSRTTFHG